MLGEYDLKTTIDCEGAICAPLPQRIPPKFAINHPEWDPRNFRAGNDIALVRLERPAKLGLVRQQSEVARISEVSYSIYRILILSGFLMSFPSAYLGTRKIRASIPKPTLWPKSRDGDG